MSDVTDDAEATTERRAVASKGRPTPRAFRATALTGPVFHCLCCVRSSRLAHADSSVRGSEDRRQPDLERLPETAHAAFCEPRLHHRVTHALLTLASLPLLLGTVKLDLGAAFSGSRLPRRSA